MFDGLRRSDEMDEDEKRTKKERRGSRYLFFKRSTIELVIILWGY